MSQKNRYHVQETENAYGEGSYIAPHKWHTVSRHRTLKGAVRAQRRLIDAMRRRCGPNARDSEQQIYDTEAGRPYGATDQEMRQIERLEWELIDDRARYNADRRQEKF